MPRECPDGYFLKVKAGTTIRGIAKKQIQNLLKRKKNNGRGRTYIYEVNKVLLYEEEHHGAEIIDTKLS